MGGGRGRGSGTQADPQVAHCSAPLGAKAVITWYNYTVYSAGRTVSGTTVSLTRFRPPSLGFEAMAESVMDRRMFRVL